jgi:hypothetical protein
MFENEDVIRGITGVVAEADESYEFEHWSSGIFLPDY